ncbi:hypothetical protein M422DRAFT_58539 [Sphaerobolus stellatus SS14]|nr:hypothetical protein M422DRAFT_58539 [Sphaerobolus stellatus SS14]
MQAYLAEKYMSGPKAERILEKLVPEKTKKKKKRKAAEAGLSHAYAVKDDDGGWGAPVNEGNDDEESENEVIVAHDRSFKKRNTGDGWQTVRESIKSEEPPAADEQPQVVEAEAPIGGLLTKEQLAKKFGKKDSEKVEVSAEAMETVYRDASGRKIDTKAARAEAARLRKEQEEREAKKMEWGKGLVQREEKEKERRELEKEKTRGLARYADDKELNEDLKAQDRWNDPAAAFLTKKKTKGPRRPEYTGPPPPPNRFGIKPGYRWDGVDRSNGFEKKYFQSINSKKRFGDEAHAWSVEDM